MTADEILLAAMHLSLGCLFIFAAVSKMRAWRTLRNGVERLAMHRLPGAWSRFIAAGLPHVELMLGVGLLIGFRPEILAIIASALLAAFSALIVVHLRHGSRAPCHCFGKGEAVIGPGILVRNLILLAMALGIAVAAWGYPSTTFALPWLLRLSGPEVTALLVVVANSIVVVLALGESSAAFVE